MSVVVEVSMLASELSEVLSYDKSGGVFRWKKSRGRVSAGAEAGATDGFGYRLIRVFGTLYKAHRLAWLMVHGDWPSGDIDHINGVKGDNRIENLRDVVAMENQHSIFKAQKGNKTGFRGVTRDSGKFKAQIVSDGKQVHLGMFFTPEEAHAAYLSAKARLHPSSNISRPYVLGGMK